MEPRRIVIRKYENRRLYDTANSRYVNLDEVAALIREGADVQVVDARTGEDLTRLILTQIILEDAKGREFALPSDILRQLVIASGQVSQEGMANYFKAVTDWYQNAYRAFVPGSPADMMRAMFSPAAQPPWFYGQSGPTQAAPPPPPPSPSPESPSPERSGEPADLASLRQRIDELERQLRGNGRVPKPRKQRRRPGK
jgi:polyhydroxyalkanoate synthesis repressor PhaR